jgi:hypothetical protein
MILTVDERRLLPRQFRRESDEPTLHSARNSLRVRALAQSC